MHRPSGQKVKGQGHAVIALPTWICRSIWLLLFLVQSTVSIDADIAWLDWVSGSRVSPPGERDDANYRWRRSHLRALFHTAHARQKVFRYTTRNSTGSRPTRWRHRHNTTWPRRSSRRRNYVTHGAAGFYSHPESCQTCPERSNRK